MNNDLISRSELKKACAEVVKSSNNSDFIPCPTWNDAMEIIDNAPTVSDRYSEGYAQGYIDGSTGADWKGGAEE